MPAILIVDDRVVTRQGLRHVLADEFRDIVFGEARSAREALAQSAKRSWDLIICDLSDGFRTVEEILRHIPAARILVVSGDAEPGLAVRLYQTGVRGCVSARASRSELAKAVNSVLGGKLNFDESVSRESGLSASASKLSGREKQIGLLLASGLRASEIAANLDLSIKTVSTYKHRVLTKLKLKSVADLVRYTLDHDLRANSRPRRKF